MPKDIIYYISNPHNGWGVERACHARILTGGMYDSVQGIADSIARAVHTHKYRFSHIGAIYTRDGHTEVFAHDDHISICESVMRQVQISNYAISVPYVKDIVYYGTFRGLPSPHDVISTNIRDDAICLAIANAIWFRNGVCPADLRMRQRTVASNVRQRIKRIKRILQDPILQRNSDSRFIYRIPNSQRAAIGSFSRYVMPVIADARPMADLAWTPREDSQPIQAIHELEEI